MSLVLHLKPHDAFFIGSDIRIRIEEGERKGTTKVVIDAPRDLKVLREELFYKGEPDTEQMHELRMALLEKGWLCGTTS